jgi:hypothetical protein
MLILNSLFGGLSCGGVRYSLAKDFKYQGGFMKNLKNRWNHHTLKENTFGAHPTKMKMPEDYAKQI